MRRVGWLLFAWAVAVIAGASVAWTVLRTVHCEVPLPIREPPRVPSSNEEQAGLAAEESKAKPFVRSALEFHPAVAPVSIGVEVDKLLEHSDLDDPDVREFCELESPMTPNGQVAVALGTTNGFSGTKVRLVLDPSKKTATALVADFVDAGPAQFEWSDVQGSIRITDWKLNDRTLIEVDLQGRWAGSDGESGRQPLHSIRVCAQLPAGEPFVDLQVIVDPSLVVPDSTKKDVYTKVDWNAHGTGLVTVWIGDGNGYRHSGAELMLDTITHTARVRASDGIDVAGSTRFWKSLVGEVHLSSWDLDPATTKISIDLRGELNGGKRHLQRVSPLDDIRRGEKYR